MGQWSGTLRVAPSLKAPRRSPWPGGGGAGHVPAAEPGPGGPQACARCCWAERQCGTSPVTPTEARERTEGAVPGVVTAACARGTGVRDPRCTTPAAHWPGQTVPAQHSSGEGTGAHGRWWPPWQDIRRRAAPRGPFPPPSSRGTAQSKSQRGKNSAATTARPGPRRQRPSSAHRSSSSTRTPQNSQGRGHSPPSPSEHLPGSSCVLRGSSALIRFQQHLGAGTGALRGLPRTPLFGAGPAARGGGTPVAETPGTRSPLRPPRRSPAAPSSLRSFLSITHLPALITIAGGRGCSPGPGAAVGGHLSGTPPSPPGEQQGGGRGLQTAAGRCPQPRTSSPSTPSPSCFVPLVSSLAGFTWGTFLKC